MIEAIFTILCPRSLLQHNNRHHSSFAYAHISCAAYQWDYVFDWTVLKYQQSQATRRVHRDPTQLPGEEAEEEQQQLSRVK